MQQTCPGSKAALHLLAAPFQMAAPRRHQGCAENQHQYFHGKGTAAGFVDDRKGHCHSAWGRLGGVGNGGDPNTLLIQEGVACSVETFSGKSVIVVLCLCDVLSTLLLFA
ncbi:hypothetical protein E2C01_017059 [Portunus trituberculatus]|uniref:Uncharacterized protein n=1 Tax=Portunus trituberculatus TaxID=210409 RepID=A0A5B7DSF4_PORTR|nr:hypothetical protein [Portunus trituberculatus]